MSDFDFQNGTQQIYPVGAGYVTGGPPHSLDVSWDKKYLLAAVSSGLVLVDLTTGTTQKPSLPAGVKTVAYVAAGKGSSFYLSGEADKPDPSGKFKLWDFDPTSPSVKPNLKVNWKGCSAPPIAFREGSNFLTYIGANDAYISKSITGIFVEPASPPNPLWSMKVHDSAGEAEAGSLRIVRDSNSSEYYLSYRAARMGKYYAVHNLVDSEGYIDTTKSRVSLSYDSWDLAYFGEYIYFTVQPGPKEVTRLMRVDKKGVYEEKQKYNDKQALIVVR